MIISITRDISFRLKTFIHVFNFFTRFVNVTCYLQFRFICYRCFIWNFRCEDVINVCSYTRHFICMIISITRDISFRLKTFIHVFNFFTRFVNVTSYLQFRFICYRCFIWNFRGEDVIDVCSYTRHFICVIISITRDISFWLKTFIHVFNFFTRFVNVTSYLQFRFICYRCFIWNFRGEDVIDVCSYTRHFICVIISITRDISFWLKTFIHVFNFFTRFVNVTSHL